MSDSIKYFVHLIESRVNPAQSPIRVEACTTSERKMENKMKRIYDAVDGKFFEHFEFHIRDTSLRNVAAHMYKPKDASSLAVIRILFGIAMLFDIPDERGGAVMMERWGNPSTCHFPLLPFLEPLPMPHMAAMYSGLWLGALGIALGFKFRLSAITFTVSYWYLLLADKSYWNNHSYLFGLVALLLAFTQANCYWSVDAIMDPSVPSQTVPYWNYFVLKYQFFILYFMAGVKKGTAEWLTGYSVLNLSEHWVFTPIKLFLTVPQTDYLIVHWFVFAFDLTVAFWMMWSRTRHIAMIFCALFHLMNIRLFRIGMFPWVCLATMPLFYPFHWPKLVITYFKNIYNASKSRILKWTHMIKNGRFSKNNTVNEDIKDDTKEENMAEEASECSSEIDNKIANDNQESDETVNNNDENETEAETEIPKHETADKGKIDEYQKMFTCILIGFYLVTQAFLPFSHFITKGYNNWTNGLYGYSWDMMVHTWDLHSVVVKVVDNVNNTEYYVDPNHFTENDRWTRHGDMVHQYARCLKDNMSKEKEGCKCSDSQIYLSENISIYVDVWTSLNGRFTQRMFDSKVDILKAPWSPFSPISYLMPLIDEGLVWRERLLNVRETVHSWNNWSEVVFIADFPGYEYEKYIPTELKNVTLTVLDGIVVYEPEAATDMITKSYKLRNGNRMKLPSGIFHKVINIGRKPAFYMFTFYNSTAADDEVYKVATKFPLLTEISRRFKDMARFAKNILTSFYKLYFNISKCQ